MTTSDDDYEETRPGLELRIQITPDAYPELRKQYAQEILKTGKPRCTFIKITEYEDIGLGLVAVIRVEMPEDKD